MYRLAVVGYGFMRYWGEAREVFAGLSSRGCSVEFFDTPPRGEEDLARALEGCDFVIASTRPRYGRRFFELNKSVVLIARHGVGYDNIDIRAAEEAGVYVIRVPNHVERDSVAEHAVALMLASLRRVVRADRAVRSGEIQALRYTAEYLERLSAPKNLGECVVGIVGLGSIGSRVAEILVKGFGSKVIAFDPYVGEERARSLGVELVKSLEELFERSDIVSIHTLLTEETRGLVGRKILERARRGLVIINTARGEVVDTEALLEALQEGKVDTAALDVTDPEPLPSGHPLAGAENTVLTPHVAAFVKTTQRRMLESIARAIANFIDGRPLEEHAVVVAKPRAPRRLARA